MKKEIKYISADEAVRVVKSGDHIHLSSVASVPHILIQALVRRADAGELEDVRFHHFHTEGPAPYSEEKYAGIFFDQGFFLGPNVRPNVNGGWADYLPVLRFRGQVAIMLQFPETWMSMRISAEWFPIPARSVISKMGSDKKRVVYTYPPDENGMASLGTSVDCSLAAIESADHVIGVINPNVPYAYGDLVDLNLVDSFVRDDTPLVTAAFAEPTPTEVLIGKNCAALVPDGACIQMGIGALPNALAAQLTDHMNLGVHTEMFADGVLRLIRKGVINGACKKIDRGKVVASFLLGSQDVYSFIDHNPDVLMKDIKYTNDPWIIAQNPRMMAINSATEVDLTGQICADSIGPRIFSGTGGQLDFVKGATMSEGGISITAFASRTNKGKNKIVPTLNPGAGVVTPRADAHWIVTEYGAVDLTGKSLQERAKLLTSIAHPDDREMLERAAFERFGPHYYRFGL